MGLAWTRGVATPSTMPRYDEEFACLASHLDEMEVGMLQSLLEGAGIPSLAHGPDFDVAELGSSHALLRGRDLLVPRSALERAQALLEEAGWGGSEEADAPDKG